VNTYPTINEAKTKELNTTKIQAYNTKQQNGPFLLIAGKRDKKSQDSLKKHK
jgi:hypothetical protein